MSKHTPGPWSLIFNEQSKRDHIGQWLIHADGMPVGSSRRCTQDKPKPLADARLIAAAPDLLAACNALVEWFDSVDDPLTPARAIEAARAAIAKAEGVS